MCQTPVHKHFFIQISIWWDHQASCFHEYGNKKMSWLNCNVIPTFFLGIYLHFPCIYIPIFDSQIYQNTAESLILPGFFSGAFSFYYIVFFLNQIWMIDFYDFSRDCLLSFWISFIFLLVRNS